MAQSSCLRAASSIAARWFIRSNGLRAPGRGARSRTHSDSTRACLCSFGSRAAPAQPFGDHALVFPILTGRWSYRVQTAEPPLFSEPTNPVSTSLSPVIAMSGFGSNARNRTRLRGSPRSECMIRVTAIRTGRRPDERPAAGTACSESQSFRRATCHLFCAQD